MSGGAASTTRRMRSLQRLLIRTPPSHGREMDAGSLAAGPRRSGCTLALPYRPARRGIALLGGRIAHSSQPHAAVTSAAVDLVILSDSLVADLVWCVTCTAGASRIFPSGYATASGWWGRR